MNRVLPVLILSFSVLFSSSLFAEPAKGLNVIVTTADRQTQMMSMVISTMALKKQGKQVNITFCGEAGDLALKTTETPTFLPAKKSPTMLLKGLIEAGADVKVCPLYLPNAGKTTDDLLPGITVAKPPGMTGVLLDQGFQNLTL